MHHHGLHGLARLLFMAFGLLVIVLFCILHPIIAIEFTWHVMTLLAELAGNVVSGKYGG